MGTGDNLVPLRPRLSGPRPQWPRRQDALPGQWRRQMPRSDAFKFWIISDYLGQTTEIIPRLIRSCKAIFYNAKSAFCRQQRKWVMDDGVDINMDRLIPPFKEEKV